MNSSSDGNLVTYKRFVISSDFSSIEKIVSETEALLGPLVPDAELVYKVVLLTTEAVTNSIVHGNKLESDKKVTVDIAVRPEQIEVGVSDEGQGFDLTRARDPLADENLLADNGRGLYLIRTLADRVAYDHDQHSLVMTFSRTAA